MSSISPSRRSGGSARHELVHLADAEPGLNCVDVQYNGVDFEIPAGWTNDVPKKGILELYGCFASPPLPPPPSPTTFFLPPPPLPASPPAPLSLADDFPAALSPSCFSTLTCFSSDSRVVGLFLVAAATTAVSSRLSSPAPDTLRRNQGGDQSCHRKGLVDGRQTQPLERNAYSSHPLLFPRPSSLLVFPLPLT
eukprot:760200-Hanusia_phi.AAC.1